MNRLEQLGVTNGSDEQHSTFANNVFARPEVFFERSQLLLRQLGTIVVEDIVPNLEQQPGRWNPGGFMVFPLGMHALGSLRLHVWPADAPRETSRGPSIHSHAWHLSSLVLAGIYKDSLFDLEKIQPSEAKQTQVATLPRLFFSKLDEHGKDVLITEGTYVDPIVVSRRVFRAGQTHTIPMGTHHLPEIPAGQTTSTLVLDSPAFTKTTEVVLYPHMESGDDEVSRKRLLVDQQAAMLVKQQIMDGYAVSSAT